jgi:DNA polymerase III subunit alpha
MIDFENINLFCEKTWNLIGEGNTKGVFQLESRLGQSMSKKLKPENIEQLAALISIMRPGCLEAFRDGKSVSNHFIDKKNGLESIDYFNHHLEPILKTTYGEMVYQEQAMEIAKDIAGFSLREADMLRKAIGKKNAEEMGKIKTLFTTKSKALGLVNIGEAEQIFSWIEKSQRYSFNKSHAVSYALNAYVSAYAKAHFPLAFFTSYLRFAKDKIDPMKEINELVNNAIESNIKIYRPDFRILNSEFELIDNIIYFGLTNIKGVGESIYKKILSLINENGLNIKELCTNEVLFLILDKINKTASKNLISVGAFDYLKIGRKKLLFYFDIISNLSNREKEIIVQEVDLSQNLESILLAIASRVNKKRKDVISALSNAVLSPAYNLDDNYEWVANTEKQLMGVAITCSVIDGRNTESANCDCQRLNKDKFLPKNILIAAEVDTINIVKTKKGKNPGQEMAFIKISDGTGSSDIIVFPNEFENIKNMLYEGNTVMLSLEQSKNKESIFAKKCWQI